MERRSQIIAGVVGGAFLLAVCILVGVALFRGSTSRIMGGSGDGERGELASPGYFDLAQLLVNEHRTESKEPFVTAAVSAAPLDLENDLAASLQIAARDFLGKDLNPLGQTRPAVVPIVQPDKLFPLMDRLAQTKDPVLRLALEKLEDGRRQGENVDKQVDAHVAARKETLAVVTEKARRGEYERTIETQVDSVPDGRGGFRAVTSTRTVDDGQAAIDNASIAARAAEELAPDDKKYERGRLLEDARVAAWKAMEPRLAELYPAHQPSAELVQFRIVRGQEFAAVNSGERVLTNVTLIVHIYHFVTSPAETSYRVYFVPRWEVGQPIYLSLTLWRSDAERRMGRTEIADPVYAGNDLAGFGGVVKVRSVAWAAEANQPEKITSFPAHAEEGARWEMKVATHILAEKLLVSPMERDRRAEVARLARALHPNDPVVPDKFVLPTDAYELQSARRVLTFAAADSEPARQAKLLIENPEAYGNQKNNEQMDPIAKLTKPGACLVGDWKLWFNSNHYQLPPGALDHKDNHGKVVLRIETRDLEAKTVTATLYDPDHPELQRILKGDMERFNGRWTIHFPGPQEEKWKPGVRLTPELEAASQPGAEKWVLLTTPQSLNMWVDGDALTCQTPGAFWYYDVKLQPITGVLAPAKLK